MTLLGPWLGTAGSAVTVPRFLYALSLSDSMLSQDQGTMSCGSQQAYPPLDSLSGGGLAS
jgi:hypothetical protein